MITLPGLPTITVKGPFWSAEVDLVSLVAPTAPAPVRLLTETFAHYPAGADPLNWVDTKRNHSLDENQALFKTLTLDDQIVFGTQAEEDDIHSHYVAPGVLEWSNYHYAGRLRISEDDSEIGITFYSRYPERKDSYYWLGVTGGQRTFHVAARRQGKSVTVQGALDSGVNIRKATWYRFHLEVADTGSRTTIRARIWLDGTPEPAEFQIDAYDDQSDRLRAGAIGLWAADDGRKVFDDLVVHTLDAGILPPVRLGTPLLSENFDSYSSGQQPQGWVDTGENNSFTVDDSLFQTRRIKGNMAFGISVEKNNVHAHYHGPHVLTWTNYAFHGRMYIDDREVAGVTFFSRFPEKRNDYYRLGTDRSRRTFHIATHPENERKVDQAKVDSGVRPKSETWYRFYIEVEDDGQRTNIRAKVWEDGTAEPARFQIETFESGPKRLRSGTIGIWSDRNGESYYDDLVVQPLVPSGLAISSLFLDRNARAALGVEKLLAPGTLVALCTPRTVTIKPRPTANPTYRWQRTTPVQLGDSSLDSLRQLLQQGDLTLLLLQVDPAQWPKKVGTLPEFTCINGELCLDRLQPQNKSTEKLYAALGLAAAPLPARRGAEVLPGALVVHSSGATLFGSIQLPWQPMEQRVTAPFQLARTLASTADNKPPLLPAYRLTVETARLTDAERRALISAWRTLSIALNPHNPLHGAGFEKERTTVWSTLALTNPLAVPDLFWQIAQWGATPQLHIAPGELTLLLSDRQLYSQTLPPTSLATLNPTIPPLITLEGNTLKLELAFGASATAESPQLEYRANLEQQTETMNFPPLALAIDPLETPRLLRNTLRLPTPESLTGAGNSLEQEPLLWGFMPLADGWAQLPIPNITAELYFQARAATDATAPETAPVTPSTLLQGAVALGNSYLDTLARHTDEQAWNLTLTGVMGGNGSWTLARTDETQPFRLQTVTLTLAEPTVMANGFCWFSTERPTAADALPDLSNWVTGLVSIPLRSLTQLPATFPPIVQIGFEAVTLSLRNQGEPPSARLDQWTLHYQIAESALDQLGPVKTIIQHALHTHPPLVWRRHPTLPMIQNLPLTQTLSPPNYPGASRQLAPYQLDGATGNWQFGVQRAPKSTSAAAYWPKLQSHSEAATEWSSHPDLSLAALSVPGLYFDPNLALPATGLAVEGWLPVRYRYDLPYTDQLNALAQLPKEPRDPNEVSPLPASTPPKAAAPLQRHTLADHWQRLSEQASLAAVATADALVAQPNGQVVLQRLIEPFVWPVAATLELATYPGTLQLDNVAGHPPAPLHLTTTTALEGISGDFVEVTAGALSRAANSDPNAFHVRAGSMQSQVTATGLRDQRGLQRNLSHLHSENSNLLVTEVSLAGDPTLTGNGTRAYQLTSLRAPVQLDLPGATNWSFWCKDLPVEVMEGMPPSFDRNRLISPILRNAEGEAQPESFAPVNDPEALAREQHYRLGYEWRLGDGNAISDQVADSTAVPPLPMNGLAFFPLTLEGVQFTAGQLTQLEIVGRLQLPLVAAKTEQELIDLSNAVRLIFTATAATDPATPPTLALTAMRLASTVVEWPLQVVDGEQTNTPRLEWRAIRLGTAQEIIIGNAAPNATDGVYCRFVLFNQEWRVPLGELVFPPLATASAESSSPAQTVAAHHHFALDGQQRTVIPHQLTVALNLTSGSHEAHLDLQVRAGNLQHPDLTALIQFALVAGPVAPVTLRAATLFGQLAIGTTGVTLQYRPDALQFVWSSCLVAPEADDGAPAQAIAFLPGMELDPTTCNGFMAFTFVAQLEPVTTSTNGSAQAQIPTLRLTAGFVEALLTCHWGTFLQQEIAAVTQGPQGERGYVSTNPEQAFGPSAGDLFIGYTTQWTASTAPTAVADLDGGLWDETFLVNGFLEVKNLISWPANALIDESAQELTLPALGDDPTLPHLRHTMRILFNQHTLPATMLRVPTATHNPPTLFVLAAQHTWQFLAVVEHQLLKASLQMQPPPGEADTTMPQLFYHTDQRWTTMQEVRLLLPTTYAAFLADDNSQVIDPVAGIAPRWSLYGHYQQSWVKLLTDPNGADSLHHLPADTILVEASAPHWIRTKAVETILQQEAESLSASPAQATLSGTTLQFLPSGSQTGILSSEADYAPTALTAPEWQLLTMPFLGRLQGKAAPPPVVRHPFSLDPILQLWQLQQDATQQRSPLLFMLTAWSAEGNQTFSFSLLDHAVSRTWSRLDPLSLEESWFRLQNPQPEPLAKRVQSIMAALPDTPARLSRSTALQQAFRAFRAYYPPQLVMATATESGLDGALTGPELIWREESVVVWQSGGLQRYPWLPIGLQLLTSALYQVPPPAVAATGLIVNHHAAATLLPAQVQVGQRANPVPVSFAVSPYLGLAQRSAPTNKELLVGSLELLALDTATRQLRPIASLLREETDENALLTWASGWAEETGKRLRPDSPLGVVRLRLLYKPMIAETVANPNGQQPLVKQRVAPLVTRYTFTLMNQPASVTQLAKRVVALRSPIVELRFRDGQFGGSVMPTHLQLYELAPPLTTGVQPVYLVPQAQSDNTTADGVRFTPDWPWGVSALTIGVQYTGNKAETTGPGKIGIIGHAPASAAPTVAPTSAAVPYTLWWHAAQQQVQFRSALEKAGPVAGLPRRFRAQAIKSLLPTLPTLPLPALEALKSDAAEPLTEWQPVLPGALRYLLVGARPGALLAIRNQLLRQQALPLTQPADGAPSTREAILVSGSVPVQHRVPRPVPLPDNRLGKQATALQTWASYVTPTRRVLATPSPAGEAFFAACGTAPLRRLQMQMTAPVSAEITSQWDGYLQFSIADENQQSRLADWKIELEVVDDTVTIPLGKPSAGDGATIHWQPEAAIATRLRTLIGQKTAGETIRILAHVKPCTATLDFRQTLLFPLRIVNEQQRRLPLAPRFLLFEDPEYNRRLASLAGRASKPVQVEAPITDKETELVLKTVSLSTDRREYNPDSTVYLRFDWDDGQPDTELPPDPPKTLQDDPKSLGQITLQKVDRDNVPYDLQPSFTEVKTGKFMLLRFSLTDLTPSTGNKAPGFRPGDALLIKLTLTKVQNQRLTEDQELTLSVKIVAEPVIPTPEAAYALLRRQVIDEQPQVECVRFAWGPAADQVDLICPEDLRQEVVRRRAVFLWTDSVRPQPWLEVVTPQYSVQKIAQNGATHFPDFVEP